LAARGVLGVLVAVAGGALGAYGGAHGEGVAAARPPITTTGAQTTTGADRHDLDCVERANVSLQAVPAEIRLGESSVLSWSVDFPSDCPDVEGTLTLAGVNVAMSGSTTVRPRATRTYRLAIALTGGQTPEVAHTAVSVKLPAVVDITGSTGDWRYLLVQALGTPNTTVRLAAGVDMDLSGYKDIDIVHGVNLTSEQPCRQRKGAKLVTPPTPPGPTCSARNAQHSGPRLYSTKAWPQPLFRIRCDNGNFNADNARLYGFRLQGPHTGVADGDENVENAIEIESCVGVEIANLELSGWSGEAIRVSDPATRQPHPAAPATSHLLPPTHQLLDSEVVRIHDNFIHHNQHEGKFGYGVNVFEGAWAKIERNVFDFDRHAITASGGQGIGYLANQNLVLRGTDVREQMFDVHGDDNCHTWSSSAWNCGNAGSLFWFTHNAFQYTASDAIKLRGRPRIGAYIENNVFAHQSLDDAVALQTPDHVYPASLARANRAGLDSYGQYGVCDFNGDGRDDLFLPTGVTWWYSSAGKMNWVYLNAASEMLGQVALGDFDGDGRCDVFAVHGGKWVISSGGTGEWRSLGTYGVPFNQLAFGKFNPDGKTDIFRRYPDGQWAVVSPGSHDWRSVASSGFPLDQLHFGDFTGDGITDVLAAEGGHWSISRSATDPWHTLNPNLSSNLDGVQIADVDSNGIDDVVRFKVTGFTGGSWEVSWDGRGDWQTLKNVTWQSTYPRAPHLHVFAGRFDDSRGADLLFLDDSRLGLLYRRASDALAVHNLYPY
jgi:hypothetical protein